jgi:hypothetical protein
LILKDKIILTKNDIFKHSRLPSTNQQSNTTPPAKYSHTAVPTPKAVTHHQAIRAAAATANSPFYPTSPFYTTFPYGRILR